MKSIAQKILIIALSGAALLSTSFVMAGGPNCENRSSSSSPMSQGIYEHGSDYSKMSPSDRAEKYLKEVKLAINLQPDQESAWNNFANAAKEQAAQMGKLRKSMHKESMSLSDRVELMRENSKQRELGMNKVSESLKALYATLTPEQRKVLDQKGRMMHG